MDWTYLAKVLRVLCSGKERELDDELRHRQLHKKTLLYTISVPVVDWTYLAKVVTVLCSGKERELDDELRHRQLQKITLPEHSICPSCGLDVSG